MPKKSRKKKKGKKIKKRKPTKRKKKVSRSSFCKQARAKARDFFQPQIYIHHQ